MSSRHQRRKSAKIKRDGLILGALQAQRSHEIAKIVSENNRHKPERSYDIRQYIDPRVANRDRGLGNGKADWAYNPKTAARIARTKK